GADEAGGVAGAMQCPTGEGEELSRAG
ncbi:hypothetical protein PvtlMGM2_0953, partial [Prevotella sp. MGM2]